MPNYTPYSTDHFDEKFEDLKKSGISERIKKAISEDLASNPYRNTKTLKGTLKGKRSARVGDYRIIFAICEECRERNYRKLNKCPNCEDLPDKAINLFDVGPRGTIYNRSHT